MTAIMNSSAAQKLTSYSAKAIENALAPKNRITERERLEAQLQISRRNRANQVAMENEEMLRKMMESLTANAELNRTVQENYDFSSAEDTSENVQENTVEATDTLQTAQETLTDIQTLFDENGLVWQSSEALSQATEKLNRMDIESLNSAIRDLGAVVEPLAEFFGKFKR